MPDYIMKESSPTSILGEEKIVAILSDSSYSARAELLRDVILVSFSASLHLNEGRQLRFAIAIEHESIKTTNVDRFDVPLPLDASHLQSLSPALSEHDDCFIVERDAMHDNGIYIVGTAPLPHADLLPPMYLQPIVVSANGPGRISLEIGDVKVVYDRGEMKHCDRSQLAGLWEAVIPAFVDKVSATGNVMNVLKYGVYGSPELDTCSWESSKIDYVRIAKEYCPILLSGVVKVIAGEIQRTDHGGALILRPASASKEDLFQDACWYSHPRLNLSEAIHKLLALKTIYALASKGIWIYPKGVLPDAPDDFRYWVERIVRPQFSQSCIDLTRQCQRIAKLASADGAVVLSPLFELEAFSAKLKLFSPQLACEMAKFLKPKGNRHNSMAKAVSQFPGSIGVVVSQDGNAVCFHSLSENQHRFFELTF